MWTTMVRSKGCRPPHLSAQQWLSSLMRAAPSCDGLSKGLSKRAHAASLSGHARGVCACVRACASVRACVCVCVRVVVPPHRAGGALPTLLIAPRGTAGAAPSPSPAARPTACARQHPLTRSTRTACACYALSTSARPLPRVPGPTGATPPHPPCKS